MDQKTSIQSFVDGNGIKNPSVAVTLERSYFGPRAKIAVDGINDGRKVLYASAAVHPKDGSAAISAAITKLGQEKRSTETKNIEVNFRGEKIDAAQQAKIKLLLGKLGYNGKVFVRTEASRGYFGPVATITATGDKDGDNTPFVFKGAAPRTDSDAVENAISRLDKSLQAKDE